MPEGIRGQMLPLIYTLAGGFVFIGYNAFQSGSELSTRYADKHYVEQMSEQVRKEAFDHSDHNHDDMLQKLSNQRAEGLVQVNQLNNDIKLQSVLLQQVLDKLKEQAYVQTLQHTPSSKHR